MVEHSRQLRHQVPTWVLVLDLAAPLPLQFPANAPGTTLNGGPGARAPTAMWETGKKFQ